MFLVSWAGQVFSVTWPVLLPEINLSPLPPRRSWASAPAMAKLTHSQQRQNVLQYLFFFFNFDVVYLSLLRRKFLPTGS